MRIIFRTIGLIAIFTVMGSSVFAADPALRTLAVLPLPPSAEAKMKDIPSLIADEIAKQSGGAVKIIGAEKVREAGITFDDVRDFNRLRNASASIGARWFIYVLPSGSDGEYSATVFMYGATQNVPLIMSINDVPSYEGLKEDIRKRIPFYTLKISSGDRYFLHGDGSYRTVTEFTDFGYSDDVITFAYPYALDVKGDSLICASSSNVTRFDFRGKVVGMHGRRGESRYEYLSAYRLTQDDKGNIFILDTGGKIIRYGADKSAYEFRTGQLSSIAASKRGNIFAVDAGGRRILVYSPKGEVIAEHKTDNETPIAVIRGRKNVLGLIVNSDQQYVVREFSEEGPAGDHPLFLRQDIGYFMGFKEDAKGNYYFIDMVDKKVVICAPDGKVKSVIPDCPIYPNPNIATAADIAVSDDGKMIFVADTTGKRVIKFEKFDNFPAYQSADDYVKEAKKSASSDQDRTLALLNAALMKDRDSKAALSLLCGMHEKEGRLDRALFLAQNLCDIEPSNAAYKSNLTRIEAAKELDRADVFAKYARDRRAKFGTETARFAYDEAVKGYERALKLQPAIAGAQERYDAIRKEFGDGKDSALSLTVEKIEFTELFSAMYKYYSDSPVGTIMIENTTGRVIDRLTAETEAKTFMDFPTESRPVRGIKPGEKVKVQLYALFNNRILSITEDTPVAFKIKLRYTIEGKESETISSGNATVYNRNALTWDSPEKLASFITPRDSTVKMCARSTVQMFRNSRFTFMPQNLQTAIAVYDMLGAYGMAYAPDPRTPFASYSKLKGKVDYIQYPRDTLRFKTGDCDDLTSMYCALLENIGIETAYVTVPGHIFMMFNTGVPEKRKAEVSSNANLTVVRDGYVWVPVETTLVGKQFTEAWENASSTYARYAKEKAADVTDTKTAWEKYAPVTLDDSTWEATLPARDMIDRIFSKDVNTMIERELTPRLKELNSRFEKSGSAADANRLGIAFARFDRLDDAEKWFKRAVGIDGRYAPALTNMGNVYMLRGKDGDAKKMYADAIAIRKNDALAHLNLAIMYQKNGDEKKASDEFRIACEMNPDLAKEYAILGKSGETDTKASSVTGANVSPAWEDQ